MKDNLIPKITKWITELDSVDLTDFKNYDIELLKTVRKIIKEVRKDYLWELKSDLENTVRNVLNIK